MNDSDRYTDFINRNTADYREEMRHMIADFIEDIVNFSDRHFVDREQTMLEVSQSLRMIPGYADMNKYRPVPPETGHAIQRDFDKGDLPLGVIHIPSRKFAMPRTKSKTIVTGQNANSVFFMPKTGTHAI